jgi:hypothetical protein
MIWTEPAWIERATAWIRSHVAVAGEIEQPHVRPWSTVMRVPSAGGAVWFKASMPLLAREAGVIEVLARRRSELVPELLAVEHRNGWMLQTDGGSRLREVAAGEESRRFWAELLPLYAELQVETAADVAELLAAGAPDRRLAALPELAKEVVGDGALVRHVARLAGELAALGLPETIQHDDFHDGNVFVRDGRYVFFDWGDSCVSHPFFTLVVTLGSIAYARGLSEDAPSSTGCGTRTSSRGRGSRRCRSSGEPSRAPTFSATSPGRSPGTSS